MEEFDDLLEGEDILEDHGRLPKRYVRDGENPLEYFEEVEFRRRYRFTKACVTDVIFPLVENNVRKYSNKGLPIPPMLQLLATLRFYGCNSFQIIIGDLRGISQATISRIIGNVSMAIARHCGNYIKFPVDIMEQRHNITMFHEMANFPSVCGCIDCTHIPIKNPGGLFPEVFRNRKGWFSLNVQVVAGPRLEILDIVVRHPGSTHDSAIFERSALRARFERSDINGILLGDNGYPCKRYLLTPFIEPDTQARQRYNRAHKSTRITVERLFGILKARFPCLHGTLRLKLETSVTVICAVATLYNIGIIYNQNDIVDNININQHFHAIRMQNDDRPGLVFREAFVNMHFR